MRPLRVLVLALLLAGCTALRGGERPLEAATVGGPGVVRGSFELGEAFVVEDVRLAVAPDTVPARGTGDAPVELAPGAQARTALARDHWVLEVALREASPGAAEGAHRLLLEWNGRELPPVHVAQREPGSGPEGVAVRFDLGERLERSSVYLLTALRHAAP